MSGTESDRGGGAIDRRELVERHDVELSEADPLAPLTVGNGDFAFTAGITGLQTFPSFYGDGIPLHTQSHWGWHRTQNEAGSALPDTFEEHDAGGRRVPYASDVEGAAAEWLRANPHRIDLGRLGLILETADGDEATVTDVADVDQTLDLWTGRIDSRFAVDGRPVRVQTVVHPDVDAVAARIESPLIGTGRLGVRLAFPYGAEDWRQTADWSSPDRHRTDVQSADGVATFDRTLDETAYRATLTHSAGSVDAADGRDHAFDLFAPETDSLDVGVLFSTDGGGSVPEFEAARTAASDRWERFWQSGAAVDLSESTDPRWRELERRVVLSQYQTAVNCAGTLPPQETGLVTNSWYGKFHLEMHWWHGVHFALWDRFDLLERSLSYYADVLDAARRRAARQGYDGVRWPKMTDPDGRESPSDVGVFLIWQQPHPIYYAELAYRERGEPALEAYREIVAETAAFVADYPVWDETSERYVLGPALIPAQESYSPTDGGVCNPTFELAYWHWALETAQRWRERLGRERDEEWDHVLEHLSEPPVRDGVYAAVESDPGTVYEDHPSMLAALGVLPEMPTVDRETMDRTLDRVTERWDWPSAWGWDFPTTAMTAARLGRPDDAVDALLLDEQKNTYLPNGHNYQDERLPLYLPGNGGLLTAVAMMAGGWDDAPDERAPGFPDDGWTVRTENLEPMP